MSDEFVKGLGVLVVGLFGWMIVSGWYTTPGFEETQLISEAPSTLNVYGTAALLLRETLFYFAIVGALVFWVVLPAGREARRAWEERRTGE